MSNITAGTHTQVQQCIDIEIIDKLISLLLLDDAIIKKEAVWAVSNSTAEATPE